ncbi:uncharacterized protein DS421_14g458670 [Arachis hypogaea]|nr:uncharacterized protein DS421_14g458670 [Arachis hypogaea]
MREWKKERGGKTLGEETMGGVAIGKPSNTGRILGFGTRKSIKDWSMMLSPSLSTIFRLIYQNGNSSACSTGREGSLTSTCHRRTRMGIFICLLLCDTLQRGEL